MPRETPYIAPEVARRWEEDREWVISLAGQGRFDDIPDYAFRLLKFDEQHVNIFHFISEGCTGTLLSLQRSMLLAFCGLFRQRLDEILEIDKARAVSPGFYSLDLIGCEFGSVSAVFAMIEWWCDGLKTLPVIRRTRQFFALFQLYKAAKMLQVPNAMFEVIEKRLDHVIDN